MPQLAPHTTERGRVAEALAVRYLEAEGYRVVARNHRADGGEVDVIAFDGEVLCFVEVRSSGSAVLGDPLESIDARKTRRIARAARAYVSTLPQPWPAMRFDAVGVVLTEPPDVKLVRDAFEV